MNTLRVTTKINCATCGCTMKRTKSIKISNEITVKEEAIKEANEKVQEWQKSLKGQNCKICKSIIADYR